jgi:predicted amidophosphoribosyltransferase
VLDCLVELLYPTRCAGCDRPGSLLCDGCRASLPLIAPARACPRCGAPEGARWCGECAGESFAFTAVRCAGTFEHPLARMVAIHKDAGERRLAQTLAGLAADACADWATWPDAVVGVPATSAAVARRGYDHGSSIAAELAALLGAPTLDALIARTRRDQRDLGRDERWDNARQALEVPADLALPPLILLVDDVFTTGATLNAAAAALLAAGAREVRGLTVARSA